MAPQMSLEKAVMKRVRVMPYDCWEWQGFRDKDGYGCCTYGRKYRRATHLTWMLFFGQIPPGMWVLHHCDNPPCCNPDHLFLGTAQDNARDRDRKGKGIQGTRNRTNKLTESQVREVLQRYDAGGISQEKLAKEFGMQQAGISKIVTGRNWKSLKGGSSHAS